MILSIFNSKGKGTALLSLMAILLVFGAESFFRTLYKENNPQGISEKIDGERPDIILLGNSMLGGNIDKKIFDEKLSSLARRDIRSTFLVFHGNHGPLFYVIIKNQIAKSKLSGIPLLIVDHDPGSFASQDLPGGDQEAIKRQLREHETVFLKKCHDHLFRYRYYLRPYSTIFYYAPGCSRKAMRAFVDFFYGLSGFKHSSEHLMKIRFSDSHLKPIQFDDEDGKVQTFNSIRYENSFLPDIIQEASRFRLGFVITHPNPSSIFLRPEKAKRDYLNSIERFTKCVRSKGAMVLNMNQFEELNNEALFLGYTHNNKLGVSVCSRLLAKAIYDAGLIK